MDYMNGYNYMQPENQELQKEAFKSQIRVFEAGAKNTLRVNSQEAVEERRSIRKERERELKKAQVNELVIDNNTGEVFVRTKNLRIQNVDRLGANFSHPEIIVLERMKNPSEKLYMLLIDLNEQIQWSVLLPEKCGKSSYLMRKITALGGIILGATASDRVDYVTQLFAILKASSKTTWQIPDQEGWCIDRQGKIVFWEKKITWEEAMKCTK